MSDQKRPHDQPGSPVDGTEATLDEIVEAFEAACNQREVNVGEFLPNANHPEFEAVVTELFCVDFERRFKKRIRKVN